MSRAEAAKGWAALMDSARKCERRARWVSWFVGWGMLLIALAALSGAWVAAMVPTQWNALAPISQLLIVWFQYRFYRQQLRLVELWREVHFHAQRMWVETDKQVEWHSQQMDLVLEKIKRT